MKWFRHETDAHTNLKITTLVEKVGIKGYGYYWFLLELIGSQGKDFRVTSGRNWKNFAEKWLGVSVKEQEEMLEVLADLNLIDKKALTSGTLYVPKMKERLDDYTKRVRRLSEHDTDKVPLQHNTTQDNTIHDINKLLTAFKNQLNPMINYANMTQRQACGRLIKAFGLEECVAIVGYLEKNKTEKYLPVITTPLHLEAKYAQLEHFRNKKK